MRFVRKSPLRCGFAAFKRTRRSDSRLFFQDDGFQSLFDNLTHLLDPLIPRYAEEGKNYLTIAIGCTGGRHRSVFVAEKLARWLDGKDQHLQLRHRDLDKSGN